MAKASRKSGGSGTAKSSRSKSIKRAVAKVPKQVRRTGTKAQRLVEEHPVISEAVAAGMLAAAAALAGDSKGAKGKTALKAALGAIGGRLLAEVEEMAGIRSKGDSSSRGKGKRAKGSSKRGGKSGKRGGAGSGG